MLTPQAQASIAAHKERQTAWFRGEKPLVDNRFGATTIGTITEIGPGTEIWTCEDGRRNWHEEPLGGIVLSIDSGSPDTIDPETGEIIAHPARYRCYDPYAPWPRKAFTTILEPEINRQAIRPSDNQDLVKAVRRFCREASNSRSLTLDMGDARLVSDAARLVAVIMGGVKQ